MKQFNRSNGILQIVSFFIGVLAVYLTILHLLGLAWGWDLVITAIIFSILWNQIKKSIVQIGPTETALFKSFGKWFDRLYGPGYYLNIPYFHELDQKFNTRVRRSIQVKGEFSCFGVIEYKRDSSGKIILVRRKDRHSGVTSYEMLIKSQKSPIPMMVTVNLQYEVINLEKYIKAGGEAEVKKVFESIASDAIRGYAALNKPEDLIKMGTTQLVRSIENAIKNLPGELHNRMELSEFGILVIHKTISTEQIEFKNKDAERDYEALSRENKQASAEEKEMRHLLEIATMMVEKSGGTMTFKDAVVAAQINMGKKGVEHKHYSGVEGNTRVVLGDLSGEEAVD